MKIFNRRFNLIPLFLVIAFLFQTSATLAATGKKVMVATAHPLATEAALDVLREGGNAVDAAVAAQWVLNVVEPQSSGIGGGGFFLFYEASSGRVYTFDGRETAPAETLPHMYLDLQENPMPHVPDRVTGGHSVGVPGTLKLLKTVHDRFGSDQFFFAGLFESAIRLAENGFPVSERLASMIESEKNRLGLFEAASEIFLQGSGQPLGKGETLVQKDLAETFRFIQKEGIRVFYEGEIAEDIVSAVRNASYRPGKMKKEDLLFYEVIQRDAVYGEYRGHQIVGMGPPSSGGTTVIEALNILDHFEILKDMPQEQFVHVFARAQKLAFQDRNRFVGDPAFTNVPVEELVSKTFAQTRLREAGIKPREIIMDAKEESSPYTSHISIVDADGNMVSFTTTIEYIFGSAMVVPGRGFLLNNELSDFDVNPWDGDRRLKPNAAEGGKRPRSSMAPTFVFSEGKPLLVVGSPGGTTIIATVLNIIANMIDHGLELEEAVARPKILNRNGSTEIERNPSFDQKFAEAFEALGQEVEFVEPFGNAQAIYIDPETEDIVGISDSRGEGSAGGF